MPQTKEEIYDSQVSPLMTQIIAICKEHKIAMLADFALTSEESDDGPLKCTTVLLGDETEPPELMLRALEILRPKRRIPMMLTTEHTDGTKTITAFL